MIQKYLDNNRNSNTAVIISIHHKPNIDLLSFSLIVQVAISIICSVLLLISQKNTIKNIGDREISLWDEKINLINPIREK